MYSTIPAPADDPDIPFQITKISRPDLPYYNNYNFQVRFVNWGWGEVRISDELKVGGGYKRWIPGGGGAGKVEGHYFLFVLLEIPFLLANVQFARKVLEIVGLKCANDLSTKSLINEEEILQYIDSFGYIQLSIRG